MYLCCLFSVVSLLQCHISAVWWRQQRVEERDVLPKVDQPLIKLRDAEKRKINGFHLLDHQNVFQVFYLRRKARRKTSHRFKAAFTSAGSSRL